MPELPEVETIRRGLEPKLVGRTILGAEIALPKMIQEWSSTEFLEEVTNRRIETVERRGKYLLIGLSGNKILALHLRMTGQLIVAATVDPTLNATYFKLILEDGNELRFRDQRKFGRIMLYTASTIPPSLSKLGPEPLSPDFTAKLLQERLKSRTLAIKKALLDQHVVAGIGNIYADEALFVAGIHPVRSCDSLKETEIKSLYQAIQQVLSEGIEHRGTTKRDFIDSEGNPGSYQQRLRVYGRKGLPCTQCEAPIAKMSLGGRGTHFCPLCQC